MKKEIVGKLENLNSNFILVDSEGRVRLAPEDIDTIVKRVFNSLLIYLDPDSFDDQQVS